VLGAYDAFPKIPLSCVTCFKLTWLAVVGVQMSYEDTIQAITRELREAFPNDPRATRQTTPKRRARRKKTMDHSDRLLWLIATLITVFLGVAATALFAG
jgi:hypothetical protein